MSNWLNRVKHLEEEHARLDKQIDQMIRDGKYEDNNIHDLKKQRLHFSEQIAKLKAEQEFQQQKATK